MNLHDLQLRNGFSAKTPQVQTTKEKINQTGLHQNLKLLYLKQYNQESKKNNPQKERNYFQIIYLIWYLCL